MELTIQIKKISGTLIDVLIISGNTTITFDLLDKYDQIELVDILKQAIIDIENN